MRVSESAQTRVSSVSVDTESLVTRGMRPGRGDSEAAVARISARLFDEVQPGSNVGRFTIVEKIGSGGLGKVYAAYDPELDRRVAIKIMHPETGPHLDPRRALREAQALAKLSHPNVVAVHEVGPHADGLFIAMELVEGVPLSEWRTAPEDWTKAVAVLIEAGRGLAAAHAAGIIHRDFKPDNVIVASDGRARVLDFGLARGSSESSSPSGDTANILDVDLTQAGVMVGTPAYLAPEQWTSRPVDARTDQWAFCVTAIEILFGKRPFAARDVAGLRAQVLAGDVRIVRPRAPIPAALERALLVGLSLDPDGRYDSMETLIDAMRDAIAPRRRRLRWISALGLLIAGASLGAVLIRTGDAATPQVDVDTIVGHAKAAAARGAYVFPPSDAPQEGTAYAEILALEATGDAAAVERAAALRDLFADDLADLGDRYWDNPESRSFALDFYATALLFDPTHGRAADRVPTASGSVALLRQRAVQGEFTDADLGRGDALSALAEPDAARRGEKIGAVVRRRGGVLEASDAASLERLRKQGAPTSSDASRDSSVPAKKVAAAPPVPAPQVATPTPSSPESPASSNAASSRRAKDLVSDGRTAFRSGRYADAERAFHRALEADSRNHRALAGLSEVAFERGRYEDALAYARRAARAAPRNAAYHVALGDACFKVLRYAEARKAYEKASALGHPQAAASLRRVAERIGP